MHYTVGRCVVVYLVLLVVFSFAAFSLLFRFGDPTHPDRGIGLLYGFTPSFATICTRLFLHGHPRDVGWRRCKLRYMCWAYAFPFFVFSSVYVVVWTSGIGSFSGVRPMIVLVGLTAGVFLTSVIALGDDVGWQGLLLPELHKTFSFTNACVMYGIVWMLWHVPIMLLMDFDTPRWYVFLCFSIGTIFGMSFVMGWLRLASGSIWPPVLLHGSVNLLGIMFEGMTVNGPYTAYITTPYGLALPLIACVAAFICSREWQRNHRASV